MNDSKRLTDRISELEAKVSLADDALDQLNRTVYRQQQVIDRLLQELRALQAMVEGAGAAGESTPPRDETPPHY